MNDLWSSRLKKYQRQNLKYLRYVLNDHLVLALMFLVGGVGLSYSNWLKGISGTNPILKVLLLVLLMVPLLVGRPVLLLKEADKVFLLPRESSMKDYIKHTKLRSTLLPLIVGLIIVLVSLPMLALTFASVPSIILIVVSILGLMFAKLRFEISSLFVTSNRFILMSILINLLLVAVGFYFSPLVMLIGALSWLSYAVFQSNQQIRTGNLQWLKALQRENSRMNRLYRFFSLFTEVPQITTHIKRRKWADPIVKMIQGSKVSAFRSVYARSLVRSGDYGSQSIRLLVVTTLIAMFSSSVVLKTLIGSLATYLIIVQITPVFEKNEQNIFTTVYPIQKQMRINDFRQILIRLITVCSVIIIVCSSVINFTLSGLMFMCLGQVLVGLIIYWWYIPRYIKKLSL